MSRSDSTDQSPDYAPLKGIADLDELVGRLVQAGMHVEYIVEGPPRPLPRLVDGSAYRIVQESLTNVARHAIDARTSSSRAICVEYVVLDRLRPGPRRQQAHR